MSRFAPIRNSVQMPKLENIKPKMQIPENRHITSQLATIAAYTNNSKPIPRKEKRTGFEGKKMLIKNVAVKQREANKTKLKDDKLESRLSEDNSSVPSSRVIKRQESQDGS